MNAMGGAMLYWAAVLTLLLEVRRELLEGARDVRAATRWRTRLLQLTMALTVASGVVLTGLRLRAGG